MSTTTTETPEKSTSPAVRPHALNRIRVHKEGLDWGVYTGSPTPMYASREWAEAEAEAWRVASRWRSHFSAWNW